MKKIIKKIIYSKLIARIVTRALLMCHNTSYRYVGGFASILEKDGKHPKHRLTDYHQWYSKHLDKNWNVLDVGCGNGTLAYSIKDYCNSITGIDINKSGIDEANEKRLSSNLKFIHGDATKFKFENQYDAIILSNVLEHIDFRTELLKSLSHIASRIILRVPMEDRDWITLYKKEQGLEYRLDKTHKIEYTQTKIEEELALAGFLPSERRVKYGEYYCVATLQDRPNESP